jgi:hypothetical protein
MTQPFRFFTTAEWDALPATQKREAIFSRFLGPREISRTVKLFVDKQGNEVLAIVSDNPPIAEVTARA